MSLRDRLARRKSHKLNLDDIPRIEFKKPLDSIKINKPDSFDGIKFIRTETMYEKRKRK